MIYTTCMRWKTKKNREEVGGWGSRRSQIQTDSVIQSPHLSDRTSPTYELLLPQPHSSIAVLVFDFASAKRWVLSGSPAPSVSREASDSRGWSFPSPYSRTGGLHESPPVRSPEASPLEGGDPRWCFGSQGYQRFAHNSSVNSRSGEAVPLLVESFSCSFSYSFLLLKEKSNKPPDIAYECRRELSWAYLYYSRE